MAPSSDGSGSRAVVMQDTTTVVETAESRVKQHRLRRRHSVISVDADQEEERVVDNDVPVRHGTTQDEEKEECEHDSRLFGSEFLAGAISGAVSETLTHPLDLIATRQSMQPPSLPCRYGSSVSGAMGVIMREEGVRALWSGVSAWLLFAVPSSAIYFTTYETVKRFGTQASPPSSSSREVSKTALHLTAGALSELAAAVTTVPGEVVRTRLQLGRNPHLATQGLVTRRENYGGTFRAIRTILREEGLVRGLYSGARPRVACDMSFSALQFAFYERLKEGLIAARLRFSSSSSTSSSVTPRSEQARLRAADCVLLGGLAGAAATAMTNPLEVVSVRMMAQGQGCVGSSRYDGIRDCVSKLWASGGVRPFFRGCWSRVVATFPQAALSLGVYEFAKESIDSYGSGR